MLILSVDSSATPASVCLYDGRVIAEYYIHTKLTHSQTLVSMIESIMQITGTKPEDIDLYAVNNGPGSFTGVRIGVSAVKGMAYAQNKPCVGVSTLHSMAYNFLSQDAVVCACMDARRQQVYNAVFRIRDGQIKVINDDRAVAIEDLAEELNSFNENVILVGDGAELVFQSFDGSKHISLAPPNLRFQRASSTAMIAGEMSDRGETLSAAALMPSYLRLSQAERERMEKQKG